MLASLESDSAMLRWWAITIPHPYDIAISRNRETETLRHHDTEALQTRNIIDAQNDKAAVSRHCDITISSNHEHTMLRYRRFTISRCRPNRDQRGAGTEIDGSRVLKPVSSCGESRAVSPLEISVAPYLFSKRRTMGDSRRDPSPADSGQGRAVCENSEHYSEHY